MLRLSSEASTLFVNIRWTLLHFKMKDTKFYTWNGVFILLSFSLFRILPIGPIWLSFFNLLKQPQWSQMHVGFKLLCIGASVSLDSLNIYWYYKIVRMAVKMLVGGRGDKQKEK